MLQLQRFGAVDDLVTAPLKRAAVGARDHETVQHGHEHRAFDIEVMVAGDHGVALVSALLAVSRRGNAGFGVKGGTRLSSNVPMVNSP